MKPWELLDQTELPDNGGIMTLQRHDGNFVIRVNGHELMSTRAHNSEVILGERGCAPIAHRPGAQVMIGGFGVGFTLAAALKTLGPDARVTVAELVPAVIEWNRGPLGEAAGHPINDPRVEIFHGDVNTLIRQSQARWDAILLDVDNGPEALTTATNDGLYGPVGVGFVHGALKTGGILGVWSVYDDKSYTRRLERAGFRAEVVTVHASGTRGRRHVIWFAEKK